MRSSDDDGDSGKGAGSPQPAYTKRWDNAGSGRGSENQRLLIKILYKNIDSVRQARSGASGYQKVAFN